MCEPKAAIESKAKARERMIWHHVDTTNMISSRQSEVRKCGHLSILILFIDYALVKEVSAFILFLIGKQSEQFIWMKFLGTQWC